MPFFPKVDGSEQIWVFDKATDQGVNTPTIVTLPKNKTMLWWLCIGGGGGGGGVVGTTTSGACGGGGGGGSSGIAMGMMPLMFLPGWLRIQVGAGGSPANSGIPSFIHAVEATTDANLVYGRIVQVGGGGAGGPGNSTTQGTTGAAGSIATLANSVGMGLGMFQLVAGQAGALGGAATGALGANAAASTTQAFTSGGSGGGSCSAAADFADG